MPELGRAWLGKQRRLIFFALALFIPVLVLTGLSLAAIRNDRASFEWVQVKEQRDVLNNVQILMDEILAETKTDIFQRVQANPEHMANREAFFKDLSVIEKESALIRGIFCVDARHNLIYPKPKWPYKISNPRTETLKIGRVNKLANLRRVAARSRVQSAVMAIRNDRFIDTQERIYSLQTMATDEAPGSEPWAILTYAQAEDTLASGKSKAAAALFDMVGACKIPVLLHDGRPLRVEAILRGAALHPAEIGFDKVQTLLKALISNQYSEIPKARFNGIMKHGKELLSELAKALGPDSVKIADALLSRVELFEARLRWYEALDGELKPYLQSLSADPSPNGDMTRQLTRVGDKPLLICYQAFPDERGHIFVGFQVNLNILAETILPFKFENYPIEKGLAFAIQDSKGNILVSQGDDRSLRNQSLPQLSKRIELLPFWRITVRRNPQTIASSATQRSLLLAGLIALALLGVAFGAFSTFRFVNQSLELASLKSDFLSSITHELKTPLTSIQMFSEMLSLGRIKNDEKRLEYYKHITSESIRLRGMIDDILDFARSEAGKVHYVLSEADFAELVQDALDIFYLSAEAKGFEIKSELPEFGELPPVDVDREAMVRVFVNLLSNAVKYSLESPEISVQLKRDGHHLLASVSDKGVGIESKNLEKIFDKFFRAGDPLTREVSGTGLGLSLVHGIVRAHDGDIRVTSEKNVGSTFTVALPIVEDYRDKWPPDAEISAQSEFSSHDESSQSSASNSEEQTASAVDEQGG